MTDGLHDGVGVRISDPATWEKAKDVIADALKRPVSERAAYVRDRCSDPALRAEIDAMLRVYEDDPDFLEKPVQLAYEEVDELSDLQPGTRGSTTSARTGRFAIVTTRSSRSFFVNGRRPVAIS